MSQRSHPGTGVSTPESVGGATTPPPSYANQDHSFILQTVMELQKSTGELTSAVNALKESIDKQDSKMDKIEGTVSGVTHKMYAAGVVLAILVVIGGFIVNKAWDLMEKQLTQHMQTAAQPAKPPGKPPAKPKP